MQHLAGAILGVLVFVANQAGGSLSVVSPADGVVRTVKVAIFPHNVQACGTRGILTVGTTAPMPGNMEDAMGYAGTPDRHRPIDP